MKRTLITILLLSYVLVVKAQWPKEITAKNGTLITIYQPQPESMKGNLMEGRAAFSAADKASKDLVFGVFWYSATMTTDRDARTVTLESIKINDVKLPGVTDEAMIEKFKALLETEVPRWNITSTVDDIVATIESEQAIVSEDLKNDPPTIYYFTSPTTLVLIDGEPKVQEDKELKMKRVINSPFLIIENPDDKKYYLYGGKFWYSSTATTNGYKPATSLPKSIANIDQKLKEQQKEKPQSIDSVPPSIFVSTSPAEIIQSRGEANFANITDTYLLYMTNSDDDIFKYMNDQHYYVLLSGRWYSSLKLDGPWAYVASDKLPEDFAKIPEGSAKDNVLVSVAGTEASKDAIRDAQVPQTAKVDRKSATCTVTYDGEPKFEKIEGTSLELAQNTSSTVLKSGNKYYCVDKGVWFVASNAKGPWKVSDERPKDVEDIPANSSAYNVKYVYIYDSTPEVVYVGYTPGYMGCYVYGPTVVYGTGYYYSPWYGPYYYPRPVTYGFSMHYNPWTGWSMGFHYSAGWFNFSMYGGGGYWGPPVYRPPYYPPHRGGIYGPRPPVYIHNDGDINIDRSNNIYNNRNDVSTRDVQRGQRSDNPSVATRDQNRTQGGNRPSQQPSREQRPSNQPSVGQQPSNAGPRRDNDVYSDKNGNVYQRNNDGNWNQRNGNEWNKTQQPSGMDRDYQNRQRSAQQNSSFQNMNRGGNIGGSYQGGGMRSGGGARRR